MNLATSSLCFGPEQEEDVFLAIPLPPTPRSSFSGAGSWGILQILPPCTLSSHASLIPLFARSSILGRLLRSLYAKVK